MGRTPITPLVAVDIVIRMSSENDRIVLIERQNPPPGWALPGGFIDVGETLETAAIREAREETSLEVTLERILGCYSDPSRDSRGHTVSIVYLAHADGEPHAADDARDVRLIDPADRSMRLAFDHAQILDDYLVYLQSGSPAALRV